MNRQIKKPELLAPAGNLEKMKVAFAFGADAVFAGIPDFSLRVRINDFNEKSLKEAIEYAHRLKKKFYVTVNIFAHNRHLKKLPAHIKKLKKMDPDGIFVSDPGVMQAIRGIWPKANIILSTQANCTNWQAAKFWQDQGIARVILGRETTLEEIKEIKKILPRLELETFVHGALCMAYSGRCFLSKYLSDRSANLGDCAQPCRWQYSIINEGGLFIKPQGSEGTLELVEEEHGSYILNSEDLCLIKKVPEMIDAGINGFKIEGRAKSVYYLATVVGAYRKAIDESVKLKVKSEKLKVLLNKLYKELEEKLAHRGYTEGFMFGQGKEAQNLADAHNTSDWEFCGIVVKKENKIIYIKVHNSLYSGDEIEIVPPGYDIIKMRIKKMTNIKGEEVLEAHGGQKTVIMLAVEKAAPEFSVLRRKIK